MEQNSRPPVAEDAREYLTFTLSDEEYAINILKVQEIRGYDAVTRIVNAPTFIKGVINLRGIIVPIVDLRIKFNLTHKEYDQFTVVIILNLTERVVGIVVDSVSDVLMLKPSQICSAPEFSGTVDTRYIQGLASLKEEQEERMLIVTDIEQLMSANDMQLVDDAAIA